MAMSSTLPRVLILGQQPPALLAALRQRYRVHALIDEPQPQAYLVRQGASFEAIVTSSFVGVPNPVLDALPNLRVVSNFGVGVDRMDLALAHRRGIVVGHTPDVLTDCVADFAWGLIIDTARQISAADRFVREARWSGGERFGLSTRVSGKRLGIVGLGRIGQAIAKRAAGFDMAVRYTSRRPVAQAAFTHEPHLQTLAAWCDFLVVATPGGAATRHLIDRTVLRALGPQGMLINVARGSVIDERALVAALQAGEIAGAGLDVFEHEPNVPADLLTMPNVVLLPHVASATHETRHAMAEMTLANLDAFFEGGPVRSPALE